MAVTSIVTVPENRRCSLLTTGGWIPLRGAKWAEDCHYLHRGSNMPLVNIVIMLIVVGAVLSLINRYIPMASSINPTFAVGVVPTARIADPRCASVVASIEHFRNRL